MRSLKFYKKELPNERNRGQISRLRQDREKTRLEREKVVRAERDAEEEKKRLDDEEKKKQQITGLGQNYSVLKKKIEIS